jgi:nitrogen regulatory protein PII
MHTVPLKRITIVAEPVLEERLTADCTRLGASGFTVSFVHGQGSRGMRASELPGEGVKIETIVSSVVADRILERVATQYFPHYAVIAWVTDVAVVRGDKYV